MKGMKLKELGEFGLIRRIAEGCLIRPDHVLKGIGDDAAAFSPVPGEVSLVTTDLLIEGVHFLRETTSGFKLGYKALAVNLSDIAAMGGTPQEAFISIAIPPDCSSEYIEELYRGAKKIAGEFDLNILGGDTTRSRSDLVINIALFGSAPEQQILYRHTARPGDTIFITGFPGESRAGLHLLTEKMDHSTTAFSELIDTHLTPKPHVREGRFIAATGRVNAAMDISDGLSSDLGHISKESSVGIRLYTDKIPVSKNLAAFCDHFRIDPVEYTLSGGEDYILAFTVPEGHSKKVSAQYLEKFGTPVYPIGTIVKEETMELYYPDGTIRPLSPRGWDHFKSQ